MSKGGRGAAALALLAIASIVLGVGAGSVYLSPAEIVTALLGGGDEGVRALILGLRLPRVVLAFLTGAALAVGGTVMQSTLENPLASPFGLGVSAGAGLGATVAMVAGLAGGIAGAFYLPAAGFAGGLATVLLALALAKAFDARVSNVTVVLTGMVISLFFSAAMDLLAVMSPEYAQRISLWQMGSFAAKGWRGAAVLGPVLLICLGIFRNRASMLDVMTFGDEQAQAMGVDSLRAKRSFIALVAVLTGTAVAFSGIIGFVDLVAPHIARRLFGAGHRRTLPAGAALGGSFMVFSDLAARTLASPREIPVGAVTALLGAPFFLYVFFRKGGDEMLHVENFSCGYGKAPVVQGISFTLAQGERLAVLGPNGCGKTTLLKGLMGILPSTGLVELQGRALGGMTVRERAQAMAMFAQMNDASFSYTVMETVLLGRYAHMGRGLFSTPGAEDYRAAEEQLKRLKLWEERDRLITELSGGQLQRVLLARTFAQSSKLILLDEPTNHLDLKFQVELVEELQKWACEPGRAAIGVFHDLDLALSFADRVLLMAQGRAVFLGKTDELDPGDLNRVYGMDVPGYMLTSRLRWERLGK